MSAIYEHFPELKIHLKEEFTSALPSKKLQQRIIQVFGSVNCKKFTFEEIGNPTVPGCTVIFELGIADAKGFSYIDEEEKKRILTMLKKEAFRMMDFFCAIRYYKEFAANKKPLKFDYYMTRLLFPEENLLEIQIFHERGPRHVPPKALVAFLLNQINDASERAVLREAKSF